MKEKENFPQWQKAPAAADIRVHLSGVLWEKTDSKKMKKAVQFPLKDLSLKEGQTIGKICSIQKT